MKFRHLASLLLLILFAHHSSEQGINLSPVLNNVQSGPSYDDSSNVGGLTDVIRNTTSNLLQRLEGPRDRIVQFIKPAIKSPLSRNVTNVLHSLWNRVQETNSSIINNPLIRNSIVLPINSTIARLREITAPENNESNIDVIDLNRPDDETPSTDNMGSSSNASPLMKYLADDKTAASETSEQLSPQSVERHEKYDEASNEVNDRQPIDLPVDGVISQAPSVVENPTKSKREVKKESIDSAAIRSLLNVIRHRLQTVCMVNIACHAASRPLRYPITSPIGRFNQILEIASTLKDFAHEDYDQYRKAREYGLLNLDANERAEGRECDLKFPSCHNSNVDVSNRLRDYLLETEIY